MSEVEVKLSEAEQLELIMQVLETLVVNHFSISRIVNRLDGVEHCFWCGSGDDDCDGIYNDLFEPLEASGIMSKIIRRSLARLVKKDLGAEEATIKW